MSKNSYYSLTKSENTATINIYGDITSFPWLSSDVSADRLSKQLDSLGDVSEINVYINSYGGEVAEGLAIYNALKRHTAKVKTYCDGFACSIASVIFMAGEERIMNESSLLMIHNAWTFTEGNADQLRKMADDLEKMTQASAKAYKSHSNLSDEEIKNLMDNETWILPEEALDYGFATSIEKTVSVKTSQSARMSLLDIIKQHRELAKEEESEEEENTDDETTDEDSNNDEEGNTEDENEDESPDNKSNDESDEEETEDEEIEATQSMRGFFYALLNM